MYQDFESLKVRLAQSPFRMRFKLTERDRRYIAEKSWTVIQAQAEKIIRERLAPANPRNDGEQTPMRGHVVFVAQHATGCCCRSCLAKWHGIAPGHALTEAEITYIVTMLLGWLADRAGDIKALPHTPELF